jgi:hypothetical protein
MAMKLRDDKKQEITGTSDKEHAHTRHPSRTTPSNRTQVGRKNMLMVEQAQEFL